MTFDIQNLLPALLCSLSSAHSPIQAIVLPPPLYRIPYESTLMQSLLDQLCAAAAHSPDALADESFARALDAQDKVIRREEFAYPQLADGSGDCVYLCGNSLGLQPLSARAYVNQELDAWAKCARGFFVPSSRCCSVMFSAHLFLQKTTALYV